MRYWLRECIAGIVCLLLCSACSTLPRMGDDTALSLVNNEPVTFWEFRQNLQMTHLSNRKEMKTGEINIEGFLDKLIVRKMFIQEAVKAGCEKRPALSAAVTNELKRQALLLLHKEEIEDKVVVAEEEAWEEYLFMLQENAHIEVDTNNPVAGRHDPNVIIRKLIEQEVERLRPTKERFDELKKGLIKKMRKERVKQGEDGYLQYLLKRSQITTDRGILFSEGGDPNQPVAFVNGEPICLEAILNGLELHDIKAEELNTIKEKKLQNLIECLVIDQEALSRRYEERPEIRMRIEEARRNALYDCFIQEVIAPSIKVSEEEVKKYYDERKGFFVTPLFIKAEEIKLPTKEGAEETMQELKEGADFLFLANRSSRSRMEGTTWVKVDQLPPPIKDALRNAKEGEIAGPVSGNDGYSIFLVKRRQGGDDIPFDRAEQDAHRMLWQEKYTHTLQEWEHSLRESSKVIIYKDRLKKLMETL